MLELLLFGITLAGLAIATFTDLKERIVPDWVSYGMLAAGLIAHAWISFVQNDLAPIGSSIGVSILTFLFSLGLHKAGFWAGGDVKLFTGIAALNPVNYGAIRGLLGVSHGLLGSIDLPIFPLSLFFFSVFAALPLGIALMAKKIAKNKEVREKLFKDFKSNVRKTLFFAGASAGIHSITGYLKLDILAGAIALVLLLVFAKKFFEAISTGLFAAGLALNFGVIFEFGGIFVLGLLVFGLLQLVFLGRSDALRQKVKISQLQEGMIPAITLVEKNGKIEEWQAPSIKSILNHLKNNNVVTLKEIISPGEKTVISSNHADGLSNEQIARLKGLSEKGLIRDTISVKESTAFVPAILLGYIILQAIGDILWNVLL